MLIKKKRWDQQRKEIHPALHIIVAIKICTVICHLVYNPANVKQEFILFKSRYKGNMVKDAVEPAKIT